MVLGELSLPVQFKPFTLDRLTFYVTPTGVSVMGVDLFDALGFRIVTRDEIHSMQQIQSDIREKWPLMFSGL